MFANHEIGAVAATRELVIFHLDAVVEGTDGRNGRPAGTSGKTPIPGAPAGLVGQSSSALAARAWFSCARRAMFSLR